MGNPGKLACVIIELFSISLEGSSYRDSTVNTIQFERVFSNVFTAVFVVVARTLPICSLFLALVKDYFGLTIVSLG